MNYVIITENDESQWDDITGVKYHYPNKYNKLLTEGTKAIYYKGRIKDKKFEADRMSNDPHYFGYAVIGRQYPDPKNPLNKYCDIKEYVQFVKQVPFKDGNEYIEEIPNDSKNYWRDGVRKTSEKVFSKIIKQAKIDFENEVSRETDDSNKLFTDGKKMKVYTTVYERNPCLRKEAIKIHKLNCMACGFNFESTYGPRGAGYIHVHHTKPLSTFGEQTVNPETDLIVLCPNCHAMVHSDKNKILSLEELKDIIKK